MKPSQFLDHFDRISEAPDAVPRLRRFILDLAVRGKLAEQNPNDESASELLKRIYVEKARILDAGGMRKEKALPPLVEDQLPYRIPRNWRWSQLGEIGFLNPRNSAADDLPASFVPMPLISAEYGVACRHEVRPWGEIKNGYTHFAESDVGLAKITPCFENGKSAVFRGLSGGLGAGTTELHIVRPVFVNADYALIFLKSPHFIESGLPRMTGTAGQKRVPTEYFAHSPFPLSPLAEQHRIVAKVNELMALCDRLEEAQAERERLRGRLTAASLHRLNQPADVGKSPAFREHVRFHLSHLHRLTMRPEQIVALRHTILSLAVGGRLVSQCPNDEPVLVQLAASDVVRAATARVDRRADREGNTLLAAEEKWTTPDSWEWRALADLVLFIDYRGRTPKKTEGGVRLITAKNIKKGLVSLSPEEFVSEAEYEAWMTRGIPRDGDVLFTTEAPMGNAAVVHLTKRFALAQRVITFRPYGAIHPGFLVLQLLSDPFQLILDKTATGLTAKGIKAAKLKRLPIAVPPLAEQHRIVAKVHELIAVCDRLKAQLTTAQIESRFLLEAVLHKALVPAA